MASGPSAPFSVAIDQFLNRKRDRPLNAIDVMRLKELSRKFRDRPLNKIENRKWVALSNSATAGRAAATRERYIDTIAMLPTWCKRPRSRLDRRDPEVRAD
jgi:hypothetical protein